MAYLDDIIVIDWSFEGCRKSVLRVMELFQYYGFIIHLEKCLLEPTTCMEFLGFILDSIRMTVELPSHKKSDMINLCENILLANESNTGNSIRTIAKLLGKISSAFLGVHTGRMHLEGLKSSK